LGSEEILLNPVFLNKSMSGQTQNLKIASPFTTESGFTFPELNIRYKTWGKLNDDASNAVLICHALTGNADADEWFPGLFGKDGILDVENQFIICSNVLGGCYGTTGPVSVNPKTNKLYQADFPTVTIRDMVRVQQLLLDHLQVNSIELAIGGSMGGMQVLEWLVIDNRIQKAMLIAMGIGHAAWTIGVSEAQRRAIQADKNWNGGYYDVENPPADGLAAARMMGMIMYRSHAAFERRFARDLQPGNDDLFKVCSYLNYQGEKLVKRFDANTYLRLTSAMDSHDVYRDRNIYGDILSDINVPVLVIGISSDILYPTSEQKELSLRLGNASYEEIDSDEGHDAFLIEFPKMVACFKKFSKKLN
jgi:homoserine O-acetyltransferase